MILSALSSKCSITPILSETLAPPKIATNGCTGLSTASPKNLISFSNKKPAAACSMLLAIPTLEACERCAVPNASLTNTSPSDAQYLPSSGSLPDSFLPSKSSKRVFSTTKTSPSSISAIAFSNCSPRVAGTKVTFLFKRSAKCSATGRKDNFSLSSSVLIRPRCENKIALPP